MTACYNSTDSGHDEHTIQLHEKQASKQNKLLQLQTNKHQESG